MLGMSLFGSVLVQHTELRKPAEHLAAPKSSVVSIAERMSVRIAGGIYTEYSVRGFQSQEPLERERDRTRFRYRRRYLAHRLLGSFVRWAGGVGEEEDNCSPLRSRCLH